MVPVSRNALLLLGVLAAGCGGGPEFDVLVWSETEDLVTFTCPSRETVTFPATRDGSGIRVVPNLESSMACLGIADTCPDANSGPGSGLCGDSGSSRFNDTCVAAFFDCYQPTGTCTDTDTNGSQSWTNGATKIVDIDGRLVPAGSDTACIRFDGLSTGGQGAFFLRER